MRTPLYCSLTFLISTRFLAAQNPTLQGHPEDYTKADIEYGSRLYSEQCNRCHGPDGTGVSGVNFKSGVFRNAATDRQLATVITNGFPTAGMPGFQLNPTAMTGVIAYLRNINHLDQGSLKPGSPAGGKLLFEGKGKCLECHRMNNTGSRRHLI